MSFTTACATRAMCAGALSMQEQWTISQHSSSFVLDCLTQISQYLSVVLSSHCSLLWEVVCQQHTFTSQKIVAMTFPANG